MNTHELSEYLNDRLDIYGVKDRSQNGLQVDNSGAVGRVGLAVDASVSTFEAARKEGVQFLILHHGLFWGQPENVVGTLYRRIKSLIDADMAVYAAHLPLDLHDELGNNAQIVKLTGWQDEGAFGLYNGIPIGRAASLKTPLKFEPLRQHVETVLDCESVSWEFGPEMCSNVAVVSGGGLGQMREAREKGFDVLITGEPSHAQYWQAQELGIHVIFCGHYATETLGVKAVGEELVQKYGIETVFLDLPTGH